MLDGCASGARMRASGLEAESCDDEADDSDVDFEPPAEPFVEPPRFDPPLRPVPPPPPEPVGAVVPPVVPVAAATPPLDVLGVLAPGTCDEEPKLLSERIGDTSPPLALPPPPPFGRGAAS